MEAYLDVFFWLGSMVLFLVIEAITVGLATIWFAAGALVALLAAVFGVGLIGQIFLFFTASLILLIFTRPIALKYMNPHSVRTNYEDALDKVVKVTARVDNRSGTGAALLNGQEWTAHLQDDDGVMEVGELAKVTAVEGVKLILVPFETLETKERR